MKAKDAKQPQGKSRHLGSPVICYDHY